MNVQSMIPWMFLYLLVLSVGFTSAGIFHALPFSFIGRTGHDNNDSAEYYSTLGIASNASEKDIKVAYRTKAMHMHPDKGAVAFFFLLFTRWI